MNKPGMVTYHLEVPEEIWIAWKDTVPRSISNLTDAIIDLLESEILRAKEYENIKMPEWMKERVKKAAEKP